MYRLTSRRRDSVGSQGSRGLVMNRRDSDGIVAFYSLLPLVHQHIGGYRSITSFTIEAMFACEVTLSHSHKETWSDVRNPGDSQLHDYENVGSRALCGNCSPVHDPIS